MNGFLIVIKNFMRIVMVGLPMNGMPCYKNKWACLQWPVEREHTDTNYFIRRNRFFYIDNMTLDSNVRCST